MKAPEKIEAWVRQNFHPDHVDEMVRDLIDVATGTREGNVFEKDAITAIFRPKKAKKCFRHTTKGKS